MATVPVYTPEVRRRPKYQQDITVRANAEQFGASKGRALQTVAAGLDQVGGAIDAYQAKVAETEAKEADLQYQREIFNAQYDQNEGYLLSQGKNAIDGRNNYQQRLAAARQNIEQNLKGQSLALFRESANQRQLSAEQKGVVHSGQEFKSWVNTTAQARLETAQNDALVAYNNPQEHNKHLALGAREIVQNGRDNGLPQEEIDRRVTEFESGARVSIIQRMTEEDPVAAAEYAFANMDRLTGEDQYKAQTFLQKPLQDAAVNEAVSVDSSGAGLIRKFEGFLETPYWDVNAFRIGYGSDTITRADGSVVKVTQGMRVSRDDAERDLARRVREFEQVAVRQTGVAAWGRLPSNAKAALLSTTYNYGSLPDNVVEVIKSGGSVLEIADAVAALQGHNNGINRKRRLEEAEIIRSGVGLEFAVSDRTKAVIDRLPEAQKKAVLQSVSDGYVQQRNENIRQQKVLFSQEDDRVNLAIETGSLVAQEEILANPMLDDGQKAARLRQLETKLEETAGVRAAIQNLQENGSFGVNAYDGDGRKVLNKIYERQEAQPANILSDQPEGDMARATVGLYAKDGFIPDKAISALRAGLNSGDVSQVAMAAAAAAGFQRLSSNVYDRDGLSDVQKAATAFERFTGPLGLTPEQAGARLIGLNDPEKQRQAKAFVESDVFKKTLKSIDDGDVGDIFDQGIFDMQPDVGADELQKSAIVADYKDILTESALDAGGDMELAKDLAAQRMRRTYGTSAFHFTEGEAVLFMPPEVTYPQVNGSHDYIGEQAKQALSEMGINADRVYLQAYEETEAGAKAGRPLYQLYYDVDGQRQLYPQPFYAMPDAVEVDQSYRKEWQGNRDAEIEAQEQQRIANERRTGGVPDFERPEAIRERQMQSIGEQ